MNNKLEFDCMFVQCGTDAEKKFAWALRKVNDIDCIVLYKRYDGMSTFSEKDYITCKPVKSITDCLDMLV